MLMRASVVAASAAIAVMIVGCSQGPAAPKVLTLDKFYSVTPDALKVNGGLVAGEVSAMKVTEIVEEGSGRVATPAKLTGTLVLKNVSKDQTVRLLAGRILYLDMQGKAIPLEDNRTAPVLKVSEYGSQERLDPGQYISQAMEVEFPVEALKAKRLKEIRVELSYIPSFYREESLSFPVAISAAP